MNIFEALRESHERQRDLSEKLIKTSGMSEERKQLFEDLKNVMRAEIISSKFRDNYPFSHFHYMQHNFKLPIHDHNFRRCFTTILN